MCSPEPCRHEVPFGQPKIGWGRRWNDMELPPIYKTVGRKMTEREAGKVVPLKGTLDLSTRTG